MLRISAFAAALVMGIYVGIAAEDTVMESWEQKGTYRNGYILNFVLSIRDSFVAEPDGYSKDVVEEISKEYPALENKDSEDDPTIIVIMNESFADLSVISHYGFETTEEVTPFFDSMDTNVIKGYALSSVFGAKTPGFRVGISDGKFHGIPAKRLCALSAVYVKETVFPGEHLKGAGIFLHFHASLLCVRLEQKQGLSVAGLR